MPGSPLTEDAYAMTRDRERFLDDELKILVSHSQVIPFSAAPMLAHAAYRASGTRGAISGRRRW